MNIKQILEAPYNRTVWKAFIQNQFTNNKLLASDAPINLGSSTLYTQCLALGSYAINHYTQIGIYEVHLAPSLNLSRNRVGLRDLMKPLMQQQAAIMVVFVQGDKWRFSYISKRKTKNQQTNQIQDQETAPKRYTYLFGEGEKAQTAATRFQHLIQKQKNNPDQLLTLNDFEEAFSVEKLSKQFFDGYKDIYQDFVEHITGKRYLKKGSKWIETQIHAPNHQLLTTFANDEKQARDFCKRMMGRIVFLYFIQKKGWLAVAQHKNWGEGNQDFLLHLFENAPDPQNFYSQNLVPLFFDTLCNPDSENAHTPLRFPYLNGGLFDKTQDQKYKNLNLPSEIFQKLFQTFNQFNFTIYEDAPDEHTVAVDPEMLGHIFENLLEDNKDKGAFYTPKDIVHYMCRESLHNYIHTYTHNENNQDFKTKLKQYNETYNVNIFDNQQLKQIERALEDLKICDPAIGSGAFPMGLLHEIYNLTIPIEDAKGYQAKSPAQIKKHIIEQSIYGVDIDSGAVDIARLRFWLSLVVDETKPQPLPNLAFKIVCANTLIPLGTLQNDLHTNDHTIKQLEQVRHKYFMASHQTKKTLETEFKNLQNDLLTNLAFGDKKQQEILLKLYDFNPFEDKSCAWFDPWWMFGVKDGFDIVIGNPPYVDYRKIDDKTKKGISDFEIAKHSKMINLYNYFYEIGFNLLKSKGILAYITPQQYLILENCEGIRDLIRNNTVISFLDFARVKVFDASTYTFISIFQKNKSDERYSYFEFNQIENINVEAAIRTLYFNNPLSFKFTLSEFDNIIEIIESNNYTFKDVCDVFCASSSTQVKKPEGKYKFIAASDIFDYKIDFKNTYIDEENYSLISLQKQLDTVIFTSRMTNKIRATLLRENYDTIGGKVNVIKVTNSKYSTEFILCLINSKAINFWYRQRYNLQHMQGGALPINTTELEKIPLVDIELSQQTPFIILVDYLLYLHHKGSARILPQTDNSQIAAHIEEVLNLMVYELYFGAHVQEVGLDILQFLTPQALSIVGHNVINSVGHNNVINSVGLQPHVDVDVDKNDVNVNAANENINHFYQWLQTPNNQVTKRIALIEERSPHILSLIHR